MARYGRALSALRVRLGWVAATALVAATMMATATPAMAQGVDHRAAEEALSAWDTTKADSVITALEKDDPSDPHTIFLRGHYHLLAGNYTEAVDFLQQAQTVGAHRLSKHYLALAKAVHEQTAKYQDHKTAEGNFIIRHEPGADEVLVEYAEESLELAFDALTKVFDFKPDHPIRVEIYPQVDVLGAVSPLTVEEIRTSGTIALCKYNRLMVTSPRDLVYGYDWMDTLAHEFIHLLITKKSRNSVPIWLHEGLAKYYEGIWKGEGQPKLERHQETLLAAALKEDALISFEDMSPSMAKLPSQRATGTAFAEVFTVIEFLNKKRGNDVAAELVTLMGQGKNDKAAVAEVAGVSWAEFTPLWEAYLRSQNYKIHKGPLARKLHFKGEHDEEDELAELRVEKVKDFVWLGDKMRLKKRFKAAVKEYQKAEGVLGDETSPQLYSKLGHALLKLERFDEAVTALEKPIPLYPRHVLLHVYLGEAKLRLGKHQEAREHLETAVQINPFDPDVHKHLAAVYTKLELPRLAEREKRYQKLIHVR